VSRLVQEINLRQLKHDGHCYRHHLTQLVAQLPEGLVLISPRKTQIWDSRRSWQAENDVYHYFWYGRFASPVVVGGGEISYIDYELDVTSIDGPRLVDEEEFAEAVERYGYSPELQAQCYTAAAEAAAQIAGIGA